MDLKEAVEVEVAAKGRWTTRELIARLPRELFEKPDRGAQLTVGRVLKELGWIRKRLFSGEGVYVHPNDPSARQSARWLGHVSKRAAKRDVAQ